MTSLDFDSGNGREVILGGGFGGNTTGRRGVIRTTARCQLAMAWICSPRCTECMPRLWVYTRRACAAGTTTAAFASAVASNDVISMNGTTTGGDAGSNLKIVAIGLAEYLVSGTLMGSGTVATPFADS